ncbi:FMN-binding negative transcriptional regulator [Bacillus sp. DX4.1]|uniref:FMN-binding negative transcriptional regulator n=1 Tax=Bacillus sp. DX4.1 TaxID=3055867 RepID=UPI0025A1C3B4|nr:FMN-binding negative transcriptional regulator [Bacillus sp. DX4.1]MDM5187970.1 FMN-binding negative transcriptional regulator [Bacillus sp. DX4.1]
MYIPKYFRVEDKHEVIEFIKEHSFATMVSYQDGKPIATHLPFVVEERGDDLYLCGHLARPNPQWKNIEGNAQLLVMFQGPHAYISPSWYDHENVPTWNYMTVHIYGTGKRVSEDAMKESLTLMLEKYETGRANSVLMDTLSPSFIEQQMKGIVGIEIKVNEIEAQYKLSQNRNKIDYDNIIKKLHEENEVLSSEVATKMQKKRMEE